VEEKAAVQKKVNEMVGTVVSDKMMKTITVAVTTRKLHPLYKKYIMSTKKVKAHDEKNDAHTGDTVRIVETRPISKDTHWKVVEIVERAK
jgi:small subunit ribosomal protein S17